MAQQVCDSHFEPLQRLDNRQYFKWQDELTFCKDKKNTQILRQIFVAIIDLITFAETHNTAAKHGSKL